MNIKQAKEQIKNTMTAYFTKDEREMCIRDSLSADTPDVMLCSSAHSTGL